MAVPSFYALMPPILKALDDGRSRPVGDIRARVAHDMGLSGDDIKQALPNGITKFAHRVGWGITGLVRAGCLARTSRGVYRLTEAGQELRSRDLSELTIRVLEEFPSFVEWRRSFPSRSADVESEVDKQAQETATDALTPEEMLDRAYREMTDALEADVLRRIRDAEPKILEQVAVALLCAMGYGGGNPAMGTVTGQSNDGGIDGRILLDDLGLDNVYVQAKRYKENHLVGSGAIREFTGSLVEQGGTKGVFVTTAEFSASAKDAANKSTKQIALINGNQLARLMVRHGVGVRELRKLEIKQLDEDYFDQDSV